MAGQTFANLPGWTFEVEEVSANVYRVTAMDDAGRRTEASGTDPDALIEDVRQWAARHQRDVPTKFAGWQLLCGYLAGAIVLSTFDVTHIRFDALPEPDGELLGYHREVGMRGGTFVWLNHVLDDDIQGRTGLSLDAHWPTLNPLPMFAGAGPTGGGLRVAVWLPLLLGLGVHVGWRTRSHWQHSPKSS